MSTINLGQIIPNIQVGETTTLEPNQSATVTNSGTELNPIFNFGIPKGQKGADGINGKDGKDGINGINGVDGKDGKDGVDGKDGKDGVGLEYNWNGTSLGIKREDEQNYEYVNLKGEKGTDGTNGVDGQDGQDGYTPIKGVDYFTQSDIDSLGIEPNVILSQATNYSINILQENSVYQLTSSFLSSLEIENIPMTYRESIIYFQSGSTPTLITIPLSVTNIGDAPTLSQSGDYNIGSCIANKFYIVSILSGIAVWKAI